MRDTYHQIVKFSGLAGLIGILAVTAGCGGGGGGSSAPAGGSGIPVGLTTLAPGATSTLPVNGALMPLAPGDEWYYAVNGFHRTSTGTIEKIVRGSYLRSIGDGSTVGTVPTFTYPNAPAGAPGTTSDAVAVANGNVETLTGITESWNIVYNDNTQYANSLSTYVTPLVNSYVEWADDADQNNLEEAGNDPCDDYGANGFGFSCPIIPLTFNTGTAVSGGTSFNVPSASGSDIDSCAEKGEVTGQENRSFTVLGTTSTITEPAGTFQVWQTSSSEVSSVTGINETDTSYWAPQIGSFVQQQSTITHTDGSTDNFTYQLVAFKTVVAANYSRLKVKK